MKGELIDLMDGTRLEVKVNFGTLYYLQKNGAMGLMKRIDKKNKKNKKPDDNEMMEVSAQIIYALLRSNGRNITFDEAISLIPPDMESIKKIMDTYKKEVEKLKKKQNAQKGMKEFTQK